jgi:hypothetical protein
MNFDEFSRPTQLAGVRMSGVKVDFRMFSGFDLQIMSLKRPIKKDTSSFNMRDTYPKIPRLSVKACL